MENINIIAICYDFSIHMQENLIICYDYILEAWRMIQKTGRKKGIMLSDKIGLRRDWMTKKQLKSG